jgi:hypothetical protein
MSSFLVYFTAGCIFVIIVNQLTWEEKKKERTGGVSKRGEINSFKKRKERREIICFLKMIETEGQVD